jgi:DNA polymerase-3 subunit alpha
MAAVLTNNMSDIKKVSFFMEECKRLGIKVLGPDVNESISSFTVNKEGAIRFGLSAVKGVGESAVESMIQERKKDGNYESVFDMVKRVDLRSVNKRTLESLAMAGAFDSFTEAHRAQYFAMDANGKNGLELAVKFANGMKQQEDQSQINMFGEAFEEQAVSPSLPETMPWGSMELLAKEKEVVGVYISGHPLDDYRLEIDNFCNVGLSVLHQMEQNADREIKLAGTVTESNHRMSKKGRPFGILDLEDYTDNARLFLFSDDYVKFKDYMVVGWHLFIQGKIMLHPYRQGELEFKISRIELLSDLRDKMAHSITLNIPESAINEDFVEKMSTLSKKHHGKCQLILNLIDRKNKETLPMISRTRKVNISDEFLAEISRFKEINYTIN